MRLLAAWALFLCPFSIASFARADAPPPDCETDDDCPGCGLCMGPGCVDLADTVCHCNEECVMTGWRGCHVLKPSHPECGGVCSDDFPIEPLPPCGTGHDVASIDGFDASVEPADAAVALVTFDDLDPSDEQGSPGDAGPVGEARVRYGCACDLVFGAAPPRLGPLFLAVAVAVVVVRPSWRRR